MQGNTPPPPSDETGLLIWGQNCVFPEPGRLVTSCGIMISAEPPEPGQNGGLNWALRWHAKHMAGVHPVPAVQLAGRRLQPFGCPVPKPGAGSVRSVMRERGNQAPRRVFAFPRGPARGKGEARRRLIQGTDTQLFGWYPPPPFLAPEESCKGMSREDCMGYWCSSLVFCQ